MSGTRLYKVREIGTERYYTGSPNLDSENAWDNQSKGKVYTKHAVSQLLRHWKMYKTLDLTRIQVVEYALLEQRGQVATLFMDKNLKTPTITL